MGGVRASSSLDRLDRDLRAVPAKAAGDMARTVRKNVEQGERDARRLARSKSGPHGAAYFKRITSEMTGSFEGEFGPTGEVAGNAVGAGWRHGGPNTDLAKAGDLAAAALERDVRNLPSRWFW